MKIYFLIKKDSMVTALTLVLLLLNISGAAAADMAQTGIAAEAYQAPGEEGMTTGAAEDEAWAEENWDEEWGETPDLADPLEPVNRLFFSFNDRLYFWLLKPAARVYGAIMPDELQIALRNFFDNLETPARAVNSLLQGNPRDALTEVARFTLNSTVGIAGLGDFAKDIFNLQSQKEDLGQTLGHYGAGGGFYIVWPFLGPSNLRDSLGRAGDAFLDPLFLLDADDDVIISARILERINYISLTLGDYELFIETALDPYIAVKDAYQQYRNGLIENR